MCLQRRHLFLPPTMAPGRSGHLCVPWAWIFPWSLWRLPLRNTTCFLSLLPQKEDCKERLFPRVWGWLAIAFHPWNSCSSCYFSLGKLTQAPWLLPSCPRVFRPGHPSFIWCRWFICDCRSCASLLPFATRWHFRSQWGHGSLCVSGSWPSSIFRGSPLCDVPNRSSPNSSGGILQSSEMRPKNPPPCAPRIRSDPTCGEGQSARWHYIFPICYLKKDPHFKITKEVATQTS